MRKIVGRRLHDSVTGSSHGKRGENVERSDWCSFITPTPPQHSLINTLCIASTDIPIIFYYRPGKWTVPGRLQRETGRKLFPIGPECTNAVTRGALQAAHNVSLSMLKTHYAPWCRSRRPGHSHISHLDSFRLPARPRSRRCEDRDQFLKHPSTDPRRNGCFFQRLLGALFDLFARRATRH